MSDKKRLITDLRVIDLRQELDKRKLDKGGVRAVLLKRLSQFLRDEGHDPDTYTFDALTPEPKAKRTSRESAVEAEADVEADAETEVDAEDALLDVRVEDMIVQDDVGDEDDLEDEKKDTEEEKPKEKPEAMEAETTEAPTSRKRSLKPESGASEAKKPCLVEAKPEAAEEVKAELNNTDAEDSINLDIGEDELLNDDGESSAKARKEEGASGAGATQQAAAGAADAAAPSSDAADKQQEQEVSNDGNTTSEKTDDKKDKDEADGKTDTEGGKQKEESKESVAANVARNLWVSGLSGDTRAKDLKQLFSKHGKVIGAKVVTNARTPGSRCYGYVTMSSAQDAENCIKNLHRTELHGRMISVEKAKSETSGTTGPAAARRPATSRRSDRRHASKEKSKEGENGEVKKEGGENGEGKKEGDTDEGKARSTSRTRDKKSTDKGTGDKPRRERSRERRRTPKDTLTFNKIWKERDLQRQRERSRAAREEERRRRAAEEALRERERRQRQEKHRLALEREKLRTERERIEREKNELLRLERERHKLEREKLELERLELKRAQLRLEEERRKRGNDYGPGYRKPNSPPLPPPYERDTRHKRAPPPPLTSSRGFEAPPPPRFEMATPAYERSSDKRDRGDYKRDYNPRHISSSNVKYPSNGTSADDVRQPLPPGTRPKEPARAGGYEPREARSAAYRASPPSKPEPRTWAAASRYADPLPSKEYSERSGGGGSGWTGGAGKSYASSRHAAPAPSTSQSWTKPSSTSNTNDNWQSSSGGGGSSGGGESRYGSSYEPRSYPSTYQPPPPGAATYADRYPASARSDYRQKY